MSARETKFKMLYNYFQQNKANILSNEAVSKAIDFNGFQIFTSELEKGKSHLPNITDESYAEFCEFLESQGVLAEPKYKRPVSGDGGHPRTSLDTPERAVDLGVLPENVPTYVSLMKTLYETKAAVEALIPTGRKIAVSIPNRIKETKDLEVVTEPNHSDS